MVAIWRHNKSHREGCKVKIEKYKVQLTFVTPLLGSQPGADTPAADFVRAKAAER